MCRMLMAETDVADGAGSRLLPYIGKVEVAKKVHIYANGDKFFAGKNFVLNPRQLRSFDAFLNQVTSALKPNFGAVRTIRTPNQGHRVDDLTALESGKSYVASGSEKFVRLGYDQIAAAVQKSGNTGQALSPRESVLKRKIQVSGRIRKIKLEPIAVYVYANGESLEPPKRLLIQPWIERDWQAVLALVNEKVRLLSGAVRRLFELDSKQEVGSVKELKNEGSYVAAAKEKFKDVQYGISQGVLSPTLQQKRRHPHLVPLKKKSPHASSSDIATSAAASTALTGSGQSDSSAASSDSKGAETTGHGSPEVALKPHPPVATRKQHPVNEPPPVARNKGGILVRPLKHKRELAKDKTVDLDKDEGGLYKAKNASSGDADTVDDTGAQTEVPVDEQKAEEVAEDPRAARRERLRRRRERIRKRRAAAAAARAREALLSAAASRIQAAARAFLRRRAEARREQADAIQAKLEGTRRTEAAVQIQAAYRGHRTRETLRERRRAEEDEQRQLESSRQAAAAGAAAKIQATYRGHRARAAVRPQLEERRRRKEEEERRRQAAAAVKIQSSYRGHRTRVELARRKEESAATAAAEQQAAAVRIQAAYRGHRARAELRDAQRQQRDAAAAERQRAAAATQIQAAYRGHRTRAQAGELRRVEAGKRTAALKIQATYRGHRTRLAVREQRNRQTSAAVKIQAAFRGHRDRKKLKELQPPPPSSQREEAAAATDATRNAAATKIQAVYRGHRARAAAEGQRLALAHAVRRHVAVTQIQGAYRKYRSRKLRQAEREERGRRAAAATKIQSTFRGHRTRKALASERAGNGAGKTGGDGNDASVAPAKPLPADGSGEASTTGNGALGTAERGPPPS